MRFDQDEWVNDIVTGAIAGMLNGAVGAMFVPDPPWGGAIAAGGFIGLATGMLVRPLKWLLNCMRGRHD